MNLSASLCGRRWRTVLFLEGLSRRCSLLCAVERTQPRFVFWLLCSACILSAQQGNGVDVSAGQKLFQKSCTACHGENAKGGRGPDLTSGEWRFGRSDEAILKNILQGIPGTEMPAFPMTSSEGTSIVAYLHSLKSNPPEEKLEGDSSRGRELFFGSANCSRCHMFAGRGGRLGPDLTSVRNERRVSELRESIQTPDKSLRRGYATVEAKLPSGQLVRGAIKAEDTFSLDVMDENEKLHSFLKQDLLDIKKPLKSLMPAPNLTSAQLNLLITFLKNPGKFDLPPDDWKPSADLNVTFSRLKNARAEPQNWLTYWGDYQGTHYSPLTAITPSNAASLTSKWTFQLGAGTNETELIVVDGLMFVTGPLNNAAALDARTGQPI